MRKHVLARSSFLLLLTALFLLPPDARAGAQDGPHGVWNGAIEVPGQALQVVVTLQRAADGNWSGTIDIPAQNLAEFPLSDIAVAGDSVSFAMAGVPGNPVFAGSWDAASQAISGDFKQAGATYPFNLSRSGDAAATTEAAAVDAETAAKIVGSWGGSLSTPGGQLRLIFNIDYADGRLSGTMDSPDQGRTGLPISGLAFDGATLRIDVTYAGAYFQGDLSADGASISGSWNQGGAAMPLTVQKQ